MAIDVDQIALEATRKIRALPPKAGIQWDAQHTARVQCIIIDAVNCTLRDVLEHKEKMPWQ